MEFRYRVGEKPVSSPPHSDPPPPPVRPKSSLEALQRELQEEKIREEIIATRLNQRRMIEEEIRLELRLQPRPLAVLSPPPLPLMSLFAAGERFQPMPPILRQEPLEFDESSSANLKKSDITDTELANRKRKTTNVDVYERAKLLRVPQPQKDWSCALCMVSATSEDGLKEHLNGKKHKTNAAELVVGKKPKEEAKKKGGDKEKKKGGDKEKKKATSFELNGETYFVVEGMNHFLCETCDVKCYSKEVMISHLSGKKHAQQELKKRK